MERFELPLQIRWADIDANFHLRHSVYYDWAAMCRFDFLNSMGLTPALMESLHFGPIIFREECVFRKEIRYGEKVSIDIKLINSRRDYSRWAMAHEIKKNEDVHCARITIDGAWLNRSERKLFTPPAEVIHVFQQMPVDADFQWLD